jgi:hypothetical protein
MFLDYFNINRYEYDPKPNPNGEYTFHPLEKKEWNYWVIEHSKSQMDKKLHLVLGLSQIDLTVLFDGVYNGVTSMDGKEVPAIDDKKLTTVHFFLNTRNQIDKKKKMKNEDIEEIREIHSLLTTFYKHREKDAFINKALDDFIKLQELSEQSPFKILDYFSILELLLTTYKPKVSHDSSLNNQLQKKINLLNNQLKNKIDFTNFFKGPDTNTIETIIDKLYQYRNDIAHGNKSDFENELKILKNKKDNISEFLRTLLKKILIHAIKEPQLIKDLKEC